MPHPARKQKGCAGFLAAAIIMAAPAWAQDADEATLELGEQVFTTKAEPNCAICHTLADAQAAGEIAPDLDDLKPTEEKVRMAVMGGVGVMPAYGETLTQEQIDAVALYVSAVAGKSE